MAGPKMKPRPKAAPTNPMPLARFSGVVESAMNACAVGMFAPAIPARMRAANSIASESARPKARYDTADPSRPARMIGRRPKMSDSRPQTGAKRNCISEKLVDSSPMTSADAPKVSA